MTRSSTGRFASSNGSAWAAPDWFIRLAVDDGTVTRGEGRLVSPSKRVEKALARATKNVAVPEFVVDTAIDAGSGPVHTGTSGTAIDVLVAATGEDRACTLRDLISMMRVVDACPNVHYAIRPLVPRDITDTLEEDTKTAFACLAATSKLNRHVVLPCPPRRPGGVHV